MALNAQLPNYFSQFDLTGGGLLDGSANQSNPAVNPLAVQTPGQAASAGQSEISQLQSQISDLISGSAGQASAAALPSSLASNSTPALTSTATLPAGLSTPATPGPVTTTTSPGSAITTQGLGSSTTGVAAAPTTAINPGSTSASPSWALGPSDLTMEQIQAAHGGSVPASGLQTQPGYDQNASRTPATLPSSLTATTPAAGGTTPPATAPATTQSVATPVTTPTTTTPTTGGTTPPSTTPSASVSPSIWRPLGYSSEAQYNDAIHSDSWLNASGHQDYLRQLGLTEQQADERYGGNESLLQAAAFGEVLPGDPRAFNPITQDQASQLIESNPNAAGMIQSLMDAGYSFADVQQQITDAGDMTPIEGQGPVGRYTPSHAGQSGYHQLDGGRWVPNG